MKAATGKVRVLITDKKGSAISSCSCWTLPFSYSSSTLSPSEMASVLSIEVAVDEEEEAADRLEAGSWSRLAVEGLLGAVEADFVEHEAARTGRFEVEAFEVAEDGIELYEALEVAVEAFEAAVDGIEFSEALEVAVEVAVDVDMPDSDMVASESTPEHP